MLRRVLKVCGYRGGHEGSCCRGDPIAETGARPGVDTRHLWRLASVLLHSGQRYHCRQGDARNRTVDRGLSGIHTEPDGGMGGS